MPKDEQGNTSTLPIRERGVNKVCGLLPANGGACCRLWPQVSVQVLVRRLGSVLMKPTVPNVAFVPFADANVVVVPDNAGELVAVRCSQTTGYRFWLAFTLGSVRRNTAASSHKESLRVKWRAAARSPPFPLPRIGPGGPLWACQQDRSIVFSRHRVGLCLAPWQAGHRGLGRL